ncbi:shikimate 3-dehydrogenase [Aureococcus anophagefferens]|nr:shikimate 3-dehydrogenase [Aureococcus anophagefferens]
MSAQLMKRSKSSELLGEPLPFIKADSAEDLLALDAYRLDYASHRLGHARGAKGERPATLATAGDAARLEREAALYRELKLANEALAAARERVADLTKTTRDLEAVRLVAASSATSAGGLRDHPEASASSPLFVFTDETVNGLYGDGFLEGLEAMGYRVHRVVIPDGEDAKTLEVYAELAERVISMGIDKHSVMISLGGGAVANVCGFVASTLHRGVGLVHFPTTLLAQCDAAISHKQAVNAKHGKNLVGSYYAPIRIIVDPDVLATLDDWLLPDGMGEIVKHALCQDAELLHMLDDYDGPLLNPAFLEKVIRRTIELKCQAISHRPGSLCCLSHGQAVAIGCVIAARVAVKMGLADPDVIKRTVDLCEKYHLPTQIPPDQSVDRIMAKLPYNKTWTQEGTVMALLESTGRLFNVDATYLLPVDDATVREALEETMAPRGAVIRGAGSSGFLRRSKVSETELRNAADRPVTMTETASEIKLFGKWTYDDVEVNDISLEDYIAVKGKHSVYLPHTAGRYQKKRFRKALCPITERLVCALMRKGRNNGKKLKAVRIVQSTLEIVHLLTDQNPVQVLVQAILQSGPREDSTRVGSAGVVRRQAVDMSPFRRVNMALYLLCTGAREAAFRNVKTIAECLADEVINAARGSSNSYAIKKKDEIERVAKANR